MAEHLAVDHDHHQLDRDAIAWLTVRLGEAPLVPEPVRRRGNPAEIISAALAQLWLLTRHGMATRH